MRYGLLILGTAACIGLCQGGLARVYDRATTAALSEDARIAIELRCRDQQGRAGRECRSTLKKLFLAGSLDPDTTLRTWCEMVKDAPWGGRHPVPPQVCVERYGGWRES